MKKPETGHQQPTRHLPAAIRYSLLAIPAAFAAADPPATNLPPIIVQASRMDKTANEIASGVTVITAEDIQRSGVADTVQALEKLGGLYFRKITGNPAQSEIVMRGFSQNAHGRVLVLMDGQRLNDPDMAAPNWARVPVQAIDRIEVLHGAQTALYGNTAVAGVVKILTKKEAGPGTSVSASAGSQDSYALHLHRAGALEEDTRYTAEADWQKSGGWRDNSAYQTYDIRGHVEHDRSDRLSAAIDGFYSWNEYGMPGPLSAKQMRDRPRQSATPLDKARSQAWGLTLGARGETAGWGDIGFSASAQRRLRDSTFPSMANQSVTCIDGIAVSPYYLHDAELAGFRNRVALGTDWSADRLTLTLRPFPSGPATSTVRLSRFSGAAYANDEFFFTDRFSLALGARGEMMRTSISGFSGGSALGDSSTPWENAFDAALLYRPTDSSKFFLRGSTLYRFPFLDEYGSYQGFNPGFNSDLDPERGWQVEAGLAAKLAEGLAYELRAYRLTMRDEIAWGLNRNENLDRTRRDGIETGLRWRHGRWGAAGLNAQVIDARFAGGRNKGENIPLVPSAVLTLDGELRVAGGWSVLAAARAVNKQVVGDDNANVSERLPGYVTFDAGVRYEPPFIKDFSLLLSCDNLLDKTYATTGFWGWGYGDSYYPANGRTWRLGATYSF